MSMKAPKTVSEIEEQIRAELEQAGLKERAPGIFIGKPIYLPVGVMPVKPEEEHGEP